MSLKSKKHSFRITDLQKQICFVYMEVTQKIPLQIKQQLLSIPIYKQLVKIFEVDPKKILKHLRTAFLALISSLQQKNSQCEIIREGCKKKILNLNEQVQRLKKEMVKRIQEVNYYRCKMERMNEQNYKKKVLGTNNKEDIVKTIPKQQRNLQQIKLTKEKHKSSYKPKQALFNIQCPSTKFLKNWQNESHKTTDSKNIPNHKEKDYKKASLFIDYDKLNKKKKILQRQSSVKSHAHPKQTVRSKKQPYDKILSERYSELQSQQLVRSNRLFFQNLRGGKQNEQRVKRSVKSKSQMDGQGGSIRRGKWQQIMKH